MPPPETAVTRLVHALDKLSRAEFATRVIPAVDRLAKARAAAGLETDRALFADLPRALEDPQTRRRLQTQDPAFSALTRDTCAITRLAGSDKINVIPPEASAEIDCRLLPDRDPGEFLAALVKLIDDPAIEVVELMRFKPGESTIDTPLFRAIAAAAQRDFPGAVVMPAVTLKQLLAGPERDHQLTVEEQGGRSTVILSAGDLFASGSAQVSDRYRPVLKQVADALNQVPGQVLVVGHSDDQPVRSFRYQNNYELSADRADAVVRELTPQLREPTRLRSTGVGSSQPRYLPPDTQVNRALNRRVEIVHVATGAPTP